MKNNLNIIKAKSYKIFQSEFLENYQDWNFFNYLE
jgi:hypothetical protein